jgi:hypothetical protein
MAFDTIGACRDDRGAVTAANEAPVWRDRCPRVSPRDSRLALAGAHQRYDDVIGDFPV